MGVSVGGLWLGGLGGASAPHVCSQQPPVERNIWFFFWQPRKGKALS